MTVPKLLGIPENEPACPVDRQRESKPSIADRIRIWTCTNLNWRDAGHCIDLAKRFIADCAVDVAGMVEMLFSIASAPVSVIAWAVMIYVTVVITQPMHAGIGAFVRRMLILGSLAMDQLSDAIVEMCDRTGTTGATGLFL